MAYSTDLTELEWQIIEPLLGASHSLMDSELRLKSDSAIDIQLNEDVNVE